MYYKFIVLLVFVYVVSANICEYDYCHCYEDENNKTVQCSLGNKALASNRSLPNDTSTLDLSKSNITILQPSELLKSDTLEVLFLNFNHINDIKPSSLQLPELKRLDLSDNELQVIQPGMFSQLIKLEYLNLANNKFTQISRLDFRPLVNLKEIILDNNNIGIDLANTSIFDPNSCGLTTTIQSISLNKINLQDVRKDYFLQADKLANLSLSGNNLTSIPYLKQLLYLDLSDNPIEVLEFDQTYPPIISVFKINNLKIKEISMNGLMGLFDEIEMENNRYLSNFSHLAFGSNILRDDYDFITRKLSMKSSNLSTLDERLWVLFKHLEVLDLQDNPWHCDCRIAWFLKLNIPLMLSQELKCATPSYFKGIRIMDLKPHDFECPQQTVPKTIRSSEGVYELAVTLGLILYTLLLIVTLIWIYVFIYLPRTRVKTNEYLQI